MNGEDALRIDDVDAVECRFNQAAHWPFAAERAADIEAHWHKLRVERPNLFNGRVFLLNRGGVEHDPDGRRVFRGTCLQTDFNAFLAWRDFGYPVRDVRNCFAMAALQGSDGGFLLGEMGQQTANAGRIYFPSGTPDPSDVKGDQVDLEGSAERELVEETGLDPATLRFSPGLTILQDEFRVCCIRLARSAESCPALVDRIHANLAREAVPELARMHIVRNPDEITGAMPPFVAAYLRRAFTSGR